MNEWVPPAMSEPEFAQLTAIEPGIPDYMREPVVEWIMSRFTGAYTSTSIEEGAAFLGLQLKRVLPASYHGFLGYLRTSSDEELVNLIDCMLFFGVSDSSTDTARLRNILELGRSEWAITQVNTEMRVTKRIPSGVLLSYAEVASSTAIAGSLLAEAFNSVYGTTPNPNHAYDLSVKAVETLACPKFLPDNHNATLGTVIKHLNTKTIGLPLRQKNGSHQDLIKQMMQSLWEGGERHGSSNYTGITLEGAKTAQALAFALVALLHEDVIEIS